MKEIGSGQVVFYAPDGNKLSLKGEVQVKNDRVTVTEIIFFNGKPNGAREINLPLAQCVVYWEPEIYETIGFE